MTTATIALPRLSDRNRHFWTGGKQGELLILRCRACQWYLHPPSPLCPCCSSSDLHPSPVSGAGIVATFTVNHQEWFAGQEVPYVVAIVQLPEQRGLQLTTNIINCAAESVCIGQQVRVLFEHHEDVWIPLFEPIRSN